MEENMQHFWHMMLYYFKKGKTTTDTHKKGAVIDQMCQKWFAKFLGTVDILAKWFFAEGLAYALEDV